ncbi:MAG: hypothetical protein ACXWBP_11345 [Limisphaerales bacterium]
MKEESRTMTVTILQVVRRLDSGGSEQATVEVTEALTRAGAKAIVATEGGRLTAAIAHIASGGEQKPSHYGLERSPPQKSNL